MMVRNVGLVGALMVTGAACVQSTGTVETASRLASISIAQSDKLSEGVVTISGEEASILDGSEYVSELEIDYSEGTRNVSLRKNLVYTFSLSGTLADSNKAVDSGYCSASQLEANTITITQNRQQVTTVACTEAGTPDEVGVTEPEPDDLAELEIDVDIQDGESGESADGDSEDPQELSVKLAPTDCAEGNDYKNLRMEPGASNCTVFLTVTKPKGWRLKGGTLSSTTRIFAYVEDLRALRFNAQRSAAGKLPFSQQAVETGDLTSSEVGFGVQLSSGSGASTVALAATDRFCDVSTVSLRYDFDYVYTSGSGAGASIPTAAATISELSLEPCDD